MQLRHLVTRTRVRGKMDEPILPVALSRHDEKRREEVGATLLLHRWRKSRLNKKSPIACPLRLGKIAEIDLPIEVHVLHQSNGLPIVANIVAERINRKSENHFGPGQRGKNLLQQTKRGLNNKL